MSLSLDSYEFLWEMPTEVVSNIKVATFGDGYEEMSIPLGINTNTRTHTVKFWFKTISNFNTFIDTLQTNKGKPVLWTHPNEVTPKLYRIVGTRPSLQSMTYNECELTLKEWRGNAI